MTKNKITLFQYIFLIHGVQLGVGILTLPRELAEVAGTDGWISIIICWFFATAVSLLIIQIMKKHPDGTILDVIQHYFGKWVGKLFSLIFALYFAIMAHVIFIREALFIQAWILPRTYIYVLILLLSIPTYLIVRKNITVLGRYSEFVFFMTLWTIFIYLIPLRYGEWLHLLPVIKEGWMPIISSVRTAIFSFIGFEIAFFLYPFLHKKEKASLGIIIANTLSMLGFLLIVLGAFLFFSPDEITIFNEPTIIILKVIEFTFVERLEIIFFSFYIFVISSTVLPFMFFAVYCISQLVGKHDHNGPLILLLVFEFIYVALYPPTFEGNTLFQKNAELFSLVIAYAFPLIFWVYVTLHGMFKRSVSK